MKFLIAKRNKLFRFADKSPTGWTAVEEYESDELADDSEDKEKLRSAERRALVKIRRGNVTMPLTTLTLLTPNPAKVHLLVCPPAVRFLLIRLFFVCSPFVSVSPNRQISALAADREATGRILQFVQAALEDPSQPSQTVTMQADESYQAVFQRLGQAEYDLPVISLNHLIHLTVVLQLALISRTICLLSKLKVILSLM